MIKGLNHVGYVVKSIDETVKFMGAAFSAVEEERVPFPEAGQVSCLVRIGGDGFELMEPLDENGVVGRFLEKHGEGLHHISLLSDNLDADCHNLETQGVKIIGFSETDGLRVAFTHPKTTGGIIYEIAQKT